MENVICPYCGKETPADSTVCKHCGQEFTFETSTVVDEPVERNKFITFWLWLGIIINCVSVIDDTRRLFQVNFEIPFFSTIFIYFGYALNITGYTLLLKWRSLGFWLLCGSSVLVIAFNVIMDLGFKGIIFPVIGVLVLYGILQLEKNGESYWDNLD